jgi:hypothetical protein
MIYNLFNLEVKNKFSPLFLSKPNFQIYSCPVIVDERPFSTIVIKEVRWKDKHIEMKRFKKNEVCLHLELVDE